MTVFFLHFYDSRRITDLKGKGSPFPPLSKMQSMKSL